jgi:hypothetical protein
VEKYGLVYRNATCHNAKTPDVKFPVNVQVLFSETDQNGYTYVTVTFTDLNEKLNFTLRTIRLHKLREGVFKFSGMIKDEKDAFIAWDQGSLILSLEEGVLVIRNPNYKQ